MLAKLDKKCGNAKGQKKEDLSRLRTRQHLFPAALFDGFAIFLVRWADLSLAAALDTGFHAVLALGATQLAP